MAFPAVTASIYFTTSQAVTSYAIAVTLTRGRQSGVFSDVNPASGSITLNNESRRFDPLYSAGPYFGNVIPGKRVTVTSNSVTIFDGQVENWGFDYDVAGRSLAVLNVGDALSRLGRASFDAWTTTAWEYTGTRMTSVLARPEVNYGGATSFSTGYTQHPSDNVTWNSNVLNYLQLLARTDQGMFFVAKDGTLTYKDRGSFSSTAAVTFDQSTGVPYAAIVTSYGTDQLFNYVSVTAYGGTAQSVSDSTSISTYNGTYRMPDLSQLLLPNDTASLALANYLLTTYKDVKYRFEELTILVHGLTSGQQTSVLGLDLGSTVSVTFKPNGVGANITKTCVVEGIRHEISAAAQSHVMTLTLGDSSTYEVTGPYFVPDGSTSLSLADGSTNYFIY